MNTFMKPEKVLVLASSRCQAGVCERSFAGYINENLIKTEWHIIFFPYGWAPQGATIPGGKEQLIYNTKTYIGPNHLQTWNK